MFDCCAVPPATQAHPDDPASSAASKGLMDWLFWAVFMAVGAGVVAWLAHQQGWFHPAATFPLGWLIPYGQTILELLAASWWGIGFGLVVIFGLSYVPQERLLGLFGHNDRLSGLWRAIAAGLLLDLCSHGILLIAAQLYRKGVGLPQVVAFLVTSPWNSVSTTLILAGLIGWRWTAVFIGLSIAVGWLTGAVFLLLERRGWLAQPRRGQPEALTAEHALDGADHSTELHDHSHSHDLPHSWHQRLLQSWSESQSLLRWLLLGIVITALMRTFVPASVFHQWFGPNLIGLVSTLVLATIVEVCSEGSAPIAAELLNRGGSPGSGFTFLMAGASTDVTELLILRQITGSWRTALFLPLITVPQILLLAWLLNRTIH